MDNNGLKLKGNEIRDKNQSRPKADINMNLDDPPVVEMRSEGRPALFQEKSYGSSDRSEIFETDSDSEESFTPSLRAPGPHLEAIGAATKATDLLSRQTEPLFITKVIQ